MQQNTDILEFAKTLARDAGAIMREYFEANEKGIQTKHDKTRVTEADKKVNELVLGRVAEAFPEHGVLAEEGSDHEDRNELWVCDPIDGTEGFILGLPIAMFSLAYVVDGEPLVAVLYEPLLDRMFTAVKGEGAKENDQPVHVSSQSSLAGAHVAFSPRVKKLFAQEALYKPLLAAGVEPVPISGEVFRGGLTASGRIDAHLFPGRSAHDVAAIKLVVEEAGGKVTNLRGESQRYDQPIYGAIVTNGHLHDQLVDALKAFDPENYIGY